MTAELSRRAFLASLASLLLAACSERETRSTSTTTHASRQTTMGAAASTTTTLAPTSTDATTVTSLEAPPVDLIGAPFTLGVASGDPTPESVILWTRLAPDPLHGGAMGDEPVVVVWEIASDQTFSSLLHTGVAEAVADEAHTLRIDASGLQPDSVYWYRFRAGDYISPVGRTRTLPSPDATVSEFSFAFSSCQRYEDGYFAAWRDVATRDLNLVIFLGDYIYERRPRRKAVPGRSFEAEDAIDLPGYRNRYARYKLDVDLQAAHAAHPFVTVWDDHELANNYGGPVEPGTEDAARRAAAYRAWWEHMPVRMPPPDGPGLRIYQTMRIGDLANLWLLDARQYRTGGSLCEDSVHEFPGLATSRVVVGCDEALSPDRTMLGAEQLDWLLAGLERSATQWDVLAQPVLMASDGAVAGLPGPIAFPDKWGGFQSERQRIVQALNDAPTTNPVVLSGDFHAAAVSHLALDASAPPAVTEFMAPPISSVFSSAFAPIAAELLPELPTIDYFEIYQGHATCTITQERWETRYYRVDDVTDPASPVALDSMWVTAAGVPGARRVS